MGHLYCERGRLAVVFLPWYFDYSHVMVMVGSCLSFQQIPKSRIVIILQISEKLHPAIFNILIILSFQDFFDWDAAGVRHLPPDPVVHTP